MLLNGAWLNIWAFALSKPYLPPRLFFGRNDLFDGIKDNLEVLVMRAKTFIQFQQFSSELSMATPCR